MKKIKGIKMKKVSDKEWLFMHGIGLKYNRYYVGNIRLKTEAKILEAYRLNLKIIAFKKLSSPIIAEALY